MSPPGTNAAGNITFKNALEKLPFSFVVGKIERIRFSTRYFPLNRVTATSGRIICIPFNGNVEDPENLIVRIRICPYKSFKKCYVSVNEPCLRKSESESEGESDRTDFDEELRTELDSAPPSCIFPCNCIASGNQISYKLNVKTPEDCGK